MGRYTGKTCRLLVMLSMTASFFFVEIVVGYIVNSLALVGDSYHMLSDVIALGVGFASVRISKWNSQKNTYGWARAEVLGALVNSVFLVALCFTIFVSAMERLFTDEHIHDPDMMIIVGAIGLAVNIIGLLLFQGHAHSHGGGGGHGHSHGGDDSHGHSHEGPHSPGTTEKLHLATNGGGPAASSSNGDVLGAGASSMQAGAVGGKESDDERHSSGSDDDMEEEEKKLQRSAAQLNMKAVFLHVLGDALGSVIVIISALVIKYVKADWAHKVDPALSIVLVLIILCTTATVLRDSALILLQTVPHHIQVKDLHDKLIQKVDGVLAVHEFHIWQLAGNRIIASAHIRCQNLRDYMRIAEEVKTFFHQEGIHSTTIQPEFVEDEKHSTWFEEMPGRDCILECGPDKNCFTDTCCARKVDKNGKPMLPSGSPQETLRQRNISSVSTPERRGSDVVVTVSGQVEEDSVHSRLYGEGKGKRRERERESV